MPVWPRRSTTYGNMLIEGRRRGAEHGGRRAPDRARGEAGPGRGRGRLRDAALSRPGRAARPPRRGRLVPAGGKRRQCGRAEPLRQASRRRAKGCRSISSRRRCGGRWRGGRGSTDPQLDKLLVGISPKDLADAEELARFWPSPPPSAGEASTTVPAPAPLPSVMDASAPPVPSAEDTSAPPPSN